jgi:PAS domain S-box-containing protein
VAEGSFLEHLLARKRVKNLKAAYLTQKGKEVPVLLSACVVEKEEEAVGIVITASDLTVYQQMENELKESELRYRTLVEYALVGIGIHQRGKIVYANQRFASMLGYTATEITDVPIADLISPEERDLILARAQRRLQGFSEPEIYEIRLLKKDGSTFQALISNALVNFNGEKATLITISDLTDTKAKRELEIANEELKSFSYSVSHDLRAPLRSIRGFSQALIEDYGDKLEDEAMDYLLRINKAAERMSQLIDDLLQLSRIGQNELNWQEVNLSSIAYDIIEELKEKEPERKTDVIIEDGLIVKGDAHLLRIALENLLSNAWKFTKGRPEARIELKAIKKEGKTIYVVQDNGAGFDMQYAQKLFKPFQRLHGQEFEGTGVGLATVKRIINRLGGEIWAEGEVAKVAVFYFTLPDSILPN